MKFTKEQAVEKLNQALTNNGKKTLRMSAKTLEAQTETLMALVGDEEMELDAFVEKVKGSLESVNSNIEHDNSDFIKEYKKAHPEPAKQEPQGQSEPPKDDDPLKKALEQIAEIQRQLQAREEEQAIEAKRSEIRKYLDDNNVKDAKWIESVLSIATVGKDDNAEEKGKTYLALYNQSRAGGEPITPKSPTAGGDPGNDAFADVRAILKAEEEAGREN